MTLRFTIDAADPSTGARAGTLDLGRARIETPVLMPVGTHGAIKSLAPADVVSTGSRIVLANTYHLFLRPGHEIIARLGGLHRFMAWDGAILTDSGGYQVFSLAKLRRITELGVSFRSHVDGSERFLSPEIAMAAQRAYGSEIAMVLDECPPAGADRAYVEKSMQMTTRWAARSLAAMEGSGQGVFGIVQGGFHEDLRRAHLAEIAAMPFAGVALGGLSVGEDRAVTDRIVAAIAPAMPAERPRYLMGVGMPEDLVRYVAHGVDMFDCVVPTRNARNGQVFTAAGRLNIRNAVHAEDARPLDPNCACGACPAFSRAYLRHLYLSNEILAHRLLTLHNLTYFRGLMARVRNAIMAGRYAAFEKEFMEGPEARVTQAVG